MPTISGFVVVTADRVKETTQTTGTGTYSLDGAQTGFRTFVAGIGSGNRCPYVVQLGSAWEVGIGTVTTGAPATLSRDVILASSNAGSAVSWTSGVKDIYCDAPSALLTQVYETPFASVKVTNFTGNGTWTRDAKCIGAWIRVVGGGGAGGAAGISASGESAEGGGGGGGEYAEGYFSSATLTSSQSVTIGTAGAGTNGNGGGGGTTSFGSLITALGGSGGTQGVATSGSTTAAGGAGGSGGTGGSFRTRGSDGGTGRVLSANPVFQGRGGASGKHMGGSRDVATGVGTAGRVYGGGGGGALHGQNTAVQNGGDGGAGIVIVEEFLKP